MAPRDGEHRIDARIRRLVQQLPVEVAAYRAAANLQPQVVPSAGLDAAAHGLPHDAVGRLNRGLRVVPAGDVPLDAASVDLAAHHEETLAAGNLARLEGNRRV